MVFFSAIDTYLFKFGGKRENVFMSDIWVRKIDVSTNLSTFSWYPLLVFIHWRSSKTLWCPSNFIFGILKMTNSRRLSPSWQHGANVFVSPAMFSIDFLLPIFHLIYSPELIINCQFEQDILRNIMTDFYCSVWPIKVIKWWCLSNTHIIDHCSIFFAKIFFPQKFSDELKSHCWWYLIIICWMILSVRI